MAVIFAISSMQQPPLPPGISDKAGHSFGYVLLGVLVVRALAGGLPARLGAREVLLALAITVAYGATDEAHQRFVPGRTADLADLAADARGSAIAVVACWAWGKLARSRSMTSPTLGGPA